MSAINNRQLLSYVERLERLEEDKKEIAADIRDVKTEAKSAGFDIKMIGRIMAERRLTPQQRKMERALLDIYRAGIGLLDGTPLGDAARERLMSEEPNAEAEAPPAAPEPAEMRTAEEAREEGRAAHQAGARIIDNPYTAGDPRRAAWDEGYCAASGSDGMDIPEAWRRKPKKAKETEGKETEGKYAAPANPASEAEDASDIDPDQEGLPFDLDPEEDEEENPADETDGDDADGEAAQSAPADAPAADDPASRLDDLVKRTRRKAADKPPGRGKRRKGGDGGEARP
ncbi:DUF2312 domain-containing protein [Xanthobacter sp. DSM 14520]|uniref:DUF2312 domain-containing protein n=1 Tax=Xanthobacter autotrophicus (strain ATCC BAA-1158 / Py2) TaxID=78245 RepID=UPI00372A8903